MAKGLRCRQCGEQYRGSGDWNVIMTKGVVTAALCPQCQTPEENAEAAINEATLTYGQDPLGRLTGAPRVDAATERQEGARAQDSIGGDACQDNE